MKIESTTNTNYVNTIQKISQTQEPEKTLEKKFDMSKPFDVKSFTFEDYKTIDRKDLVDWIDNSNLPNKKEVEAIVGLSLNMAYYTDNDTLNEVMFNKLHEEYRNSGTVTNFLEKTLLPLTDMKAGIENSMLGDIENSLANPQVDEAFKNNSSNWSFSLNGGAVDITHFFSFNEVLSNMKNFPEFHKKLTSQYPEMYKNSDEIIQGFNEILTEYTKKKDEQNAILNAYTKNYNKVLVSLDS